MDIEILDSWNEFDDNFATVKTSEGIFVISRRRISYAIEGEVEQFSVIPCRISQKIISTYWRVEENPMYLSKYSEKFRDDLSKIKDLTGVDPLELMKILKKEEE